MSSTQVCVCSSTRNFCTKNSRRLQRTRERILSLARPGFCSIMLTLNPVSNRFNQTVIAYDATKEEKVDTLKKKNVETEQRLRDRQ